MGTESLHGAYEALLWVYGILAVTVFGVLLRVPAAYGRHLRPGFGPGVGARTAWMLMESPAVFATLVFFAWGRRVNSAVAWVFLGLWMSHYLYRTFFYPLWMRPSRPVPIGIVVMGFVFNIGNAVLNAGGLFVLHPDRPSAWLHDPRFLGGLALFGVGFATHVWADATLRRLRSHERTGYRIPVGGLFERVSCPNYFGEIVEWTGWALLTWSVGGLIFAAWTGANLIPRAWSHHRWYRAQFQDYPAKRKAVFPYLL